MLGKKIYITGSGVICANTIGVNDNWERLSGPPDQPEKLESVIDYLPFTLEGLHPSLPGTLVRPVKLTNAELAQLAEVRSPKNYDRHQLFAIIAAREAMRGVEIANLDRFSALGGTGGAGLNETYETCTALMEGKRASPRANLRYLPNIFDGYLTQIFSARGGSHVHGTACAASIHAIIDGVRMLVLDEVDTVLVVGTEAAISLYGIATFNAQRALGNGHAFGEGRTGFVMGEGAAAVVIQTEEAMKKSGREPVVRIAGYGESSDAVRNGQITDPSSEGGARAATCAVSTAELHVNDITYINAHGTGTPLGDPAEIKGIKSWASPEVFVSTQKPAIGHLLGAAGVAEVVLTAEGIRRGRILPTWMFGPLDAACMGVNHVQGTLNQSVSSALVQNFGFGGTNGAVVLVPSNI